jgi:hypothetical protein
MSIVEDEVERLKMAELIAEINEEKAKRTHVRQMVAHQNSLKNDLSICSSRSDAKDTHRLLVWTQEYNKQFKALPRLDGDRDPSHAKVKALHQRIKIGRLPFPWARALCLENGVTYRINGNTSSWIAHKFPEMFNLALIMEMNFVAATLKEVQFIHAQFDAPLSSRSPAEVIKTWVTSFGIEIADRVVSPILSAIEMGYTGHKIREKENLPKKIDMLINHIDFFRWMRENVFSTYNKQTKSFTRICFLTFIHMLFHCPSHREKAVDFLRRTIFSNDFSHKAHDPCKMLHEQLLTTDAPSSDQEIPEFRQQLGWCILAWNAFTEEGTTNFKLKPGQPLPSVSGMSDEVRKSYAILLDPYIPPDKKSKKSAKNK